jgi:hypothetical protein
MIILPFQLIPDLPVPQQPFIQPAQQQDQEIDLFDVGAVWLDICAVMKEDTITQADLAGVDNRATGKHGAQHAKVSVNSGATGGDNAQVKIYSNILN